MTGFRNERLKELRRASGWSQMKLAAAADVTNGTVHRVEAGKTAGTYDTARKLARALDVPVSELWEDDAPVPCGDEPPTWASSLAERYSTAQQAQLQQVADKLERLLEYHRTGDREALG